jgi:peptidoglycan/LPS O-acetylase OafA/YrhL
MSSIAYRPEIDGLRAVAVIPVILFHMSAAWVPGGFAGVDVFFVISGFLITSIMKRDLDQGTFSFRKFWTRRVQRILPAMLFVTFCTLLATLVLRMRPEQHLIAKQSLAAMFSVANLYFCNDSGDYWHTEAAQSPFLHTWSLSVEEQFYLFFPLLLWLTFRYRPRWMTTLVLLASMISLGLFVWGVQRYPTATFYLLPTRAWELGTGCALALSIKRFESMNARWGLLSTAGLGLILFSYFYLSTLDTEVVMTVMGAALVIAFGKSGLCNTILSHRVMTHIGAISYSLYLWHWPVLAFLSPYLSEMPSFGKYVVPLCIIYSLSVASYRYVEQPMRRNPRLVGNTLKAAGCLMAMATVWFLFMPKHYETEAYAEPRYITFDCSPMQEGLAFPPKPYQQLDSLRFATTTLENPFYTPTAYFGEGIRTGDASGPPKIVVVGDSHGCMWSDAIATVSEELGVPAAFYCVRGESPFCDVERTLASPSKDTNTRFHRAKLEHLAMWKPPLILVGRYWWERDLEDSKSFIEFAVKCGSNVVLIEDPPVFPCGDKNALQWLAGMRVSPQKDARVYVPASVNAVDSGPRAFVRRIAEQYEYVDLLPTYDLFASESGVLALEGREAIYLDDDHLLQAGSRLIVPRLREAIVRYFPK